MKKGRCRIIETALPEAMIQHIQSFMNGKEAAQTTLISKSWYKAWLTRPSIDLDERHFAHVGFANEGRLFEEFSTKTMQRYVDSGLKIDSFRLHSSCKSHYGWAYKLILKVIEMGVSNLTLEVSYPIHLASEPLRSQTRLSLSLKSCLADVDSLLGPSGLQTLEELSLSHCFDFELSNRYELHKLRRLFLYSVQVGEFFTSDFASRFPCLKDLSIIECSGFKKVQIATSSLQTINFRPSRRVWNAEFDVPNLRTFTLSGSGSSSLYQLSIKGTSREWEFDISVVCELIHKTSWFQILKKRLKKFRLSRITVSASLAWNKRYVDKVYDEVVGEPLVVENLVIDDVPSSFCSALLIRLLGVFRPKFITRYWVTEKSDDWFFKNECLDIVCMRLMQQSISPSCGIPNQYMFGRFGLTKVNVEVYEMLGTEWRPLMLQTTPLDASKPPGNERKVRFELIWETSSSSGARRS